MTLVPQLTLLTPAEYLSRNSPPDIRIKWTVFLPAVTGICLVTSVVAAGLAGGTLTHSLLTTAKLYQQFALAVEASIESLASLQRQLTSLTRVAKHWICWQLRKVAPLSFWKRNKFLSEWVGTPIQQLHSLNLELQRTQFSAAAANCWKSSMFTLLMPLLGPLISILLLVTLGPFIFNRMTGFIKQQIDSMASRSLQIHYYRLDLADRGLAEPGVDNSPSGAA